MDINEAVKHLNINGHDLTTELMVQSGLVYQVGEETRRAEREYDLAVEDLKQIEAALFTVRKGAGEADKLAGENVKVHPKRIEQWKVVLEAEQNLKQWRNVVEALKQKGYSLKELVTLHTVEYYGLTPAGTGSRVGRERKDYTAEPVAPRAATRKRAT